MRVLNVAEKNDAARNIAALLSGGTATRREGLSKFNKIYEFECQVFGQNTIMIMTSVKGHLMEHAFVGQYNIWKATNPISLFQAPINKVTKSDCIQIKRTLEKEIKNCSKLIIWTDCDREGENIGFEIIEVCKAARRDVQIYRATFSEITPEAVRRALRNLGEPNKHISNAVDVRSELDLRIGAAFTRFQTLYLQKAFPTALSENLVSFGSCQFPTLGFVVERFKAISEFKSEKFWQINVQHTVNNLPVDFSWKRTRLFDKLACEVLYDRCAESGTAKVESVESRPKKKWRPKPLDTVELQKMASKNFRMSAKETLRIAEGLYTRGLISYPRTETNCFSKDLDLVPLVQRQVEDVQWGEFAQRVLRDGPDPFQGKKSDQAHPPIHPIKHATDLKGAEKTIYDFIVRHFLACLSKHAEGLETTVEIDVAGEKFSASGLMITAKNYLEVYPYEKWSDREIHIYRRGEVFNPEISMEEGETSPPDLLTEADLISLMEKHGIGTDATHAEHIETVKARLYVGLQNDKYFVPRTLGMGLVEGYNNMGYAMAKPEMRAELEADLKRICERQKSPAEVLLTHIEKYKKVFEGVQRQVTHLSRAIQSFIQVEATPIEPNCLTEGTSAAVGKCPTCHSDLVLRNKKDGEKYIGCSAYPQCSVALWLPSFVLDVSATTETCPTCGPHQYLLRFKFKKGSCYYPPDYVGCVGGCDWNLLEMLNCSADRNTFWRGSRAAETVTRGPQEIDDSGFASFRSDETSTPRPPVDGCPPNCFCGVPTACLTVKKTGPNLGKEFYSCAAPPGSSRCNFFQWKKSNNQKQADGQRGHEEVDDGEELRCYCSVPCRRATVAKEGPNKGRGFFTCGKSYHDQEKCNFFKWAENDELPNGRTRHGLGSNWTAVSSGTGSRGKKRKCGACGAEGNSFVREMLIARVTLVFLLLGLEELEGSKGCEPLGHPPHGSVACLSGKKKASCRSKLPAGSLAQFSCREFYKLSSETEHVLKCLGNGSWSSPSPECIPDCGRRRSSVSLVVNGAAVRLGDFPWHAAIYHLEEGSYEYACAGSLISEVAVITAAHCVWEMPPQKLLLAFGKIYREYNSTEKEVQKMGARRVEVLSSYQDVEGNYDGDVAVVFLQGRVRVGVGSAPVCVDWEQRLVDEQVREGSYGVIAGWGVTENDTLGDTLRSVRLPVVSDKKCIAEMKQDFRKFVRYTTFCAGFANGTGVCNGDSGGGLVFFDETSERWYLQGLVSVSPRRKESFLCDLNFHTIFTKLAVFSRWLKAVEKSEKNDKNLKDFSGRHLSSKQ